MRKRGVRLLLNAFARAVVNDDMDAFQVVERQLDASGLSWGGFVDEPCFYCGGVFQGQIAFHLTEDGRYQHRKPYTVFLVRDRRQSSTEGVDGFHNQIGGESCAACHDQGCCQCMDRYQLGQ